MQSIARQLGLNLKPSTYSARHSFGTFLMKEGVPLPYIQECYGHASLEMTKEYLGEFTEDEKKEFSQKINKFIDSNLNP